MWLTVNENWWFCIINPVCSKPCTSIELRLMDTNIKCSILLQKNAGIQLIRRAIYQHGRANFVQNSGSDIQVETFLGVCILHKYKFDAILLCG